MRRLAALALLAAAACCAAVPAQAAKDARAGKTARATKANKAAKAGKASKTARASKAGKAGKPAGPDDTGEGFMDMVVGLCLQHLSDLDALRARLLREDAPRLPPEHARLFMRDVAGDSWPVPYKGRMDNFVLSLGSGNNLCMVHARRTGAARVERKFLALVKDAPAPLVARAEPVAARSGGTGAGGSRLRTLVYTWTQPGARHRIQFTLTTNAAPGAALQAVGTVAAVAD